MPQDTIYIKQLITKSNRIETHAGTTGVNDFKYLDGQEVSPSIPYHIMYLNDGKEISLKPKKIDQNSKRLWGMNRSLINNAIIGADKLTSLNLIFMFLIQSYIHQDPLGLHF